MRSNVIVIGWCHIVLGLLNLLVGVGGLLFFGFIGAMVASAPGSQGSHENLAALPLLGGIGLFFFSLIAVLSLPGIVVGWGLITLQPWARIGGIIMSALQLPNFPIGTVLGVFGLVTLTNQEAVALFENPAATVYTPMPPAGFTRR